MCKWDKLIINIFYSSQFKMTYYVYLIKTEKKINNKFISYIQLCNDKNRLKKHNLKGAKLQEVKNDTSLLWEIWHKNLFKEEIEIKKNRKMRNLLKNMRRVDILKNKIIFFHW